MPGAYLLRVEESSEPQRPSGNTGSLREDRQGFSAGLTDGSDDFS